MSLRQLAAHPDSRRKDQATGLGILLTILFGYDLAVPAQSHLSTDFIGLVAAALLLAYGLGHRAEPKTVETTVRTWSTRPPQWIGLAVVALGGAIAALAASKLWLNRADWMSALPWWILGLLLILAGALAIDVSHGRLALSRLSLKAVPILVAVLGITILALFLRVYKLDSVPPGIFIDETNSAMDALAIVHGAQMSPFSTGWYETPMGYMYLQAWVIDLLGPTVAALKLPGIAAGLMTVLGTFFLGRLLFDTSTGLVGGLIVAFARWSVHMSRWGWNETAPPVALVWSLYFLIRGTRSSRRSDFVIAGLILGLGMYTYLSIRLVVFAVAVYLLYRVVIHRGFLRQHLVGLCLFALVWSATFAPLAITYIKDPHTFTNRMEEVTIQRDIARAGGKLDPVIENVRRHLLMFNVAGDRNSRHNLPGQPMLDPIVGALFAVAVFRALALGFDHRWALLLLWIPAILAGGIFSGLDEGPQSYRTLAVVPAAALLSAELLTGIGRWIVQWLVSLRWSWLAAKGTPIVGIGGILLWSGWVNFQSYFVDYAADPRVYMAFTPLETAISRELTSAADPDAYYLSPRLYYFSPLRFFMSPDFRDAPGGQRVPPFHIFSGPDDLPLPTTGEKTLVLLWGPEWSEMANVLAPLYPHLSVERIPSLAGGELYERVTIPKQDLVDVHGLMADGTRSNGQRKVDRVVDPSAPLSGDYVSVRWTGSIYVPKSGRRAVWSLDGGAVLLDGKPTAGPQYLVKGLHPIEVTQSGSLAQLGLRLMWKEDGAPEQQLSRADFYAFSPNVTHGLTGSYYAGEGWAGTPLFQRVDPVILFSWPDQEPTQGPFSVTWQGEIEIQTAGRYVFVVDSDDGARLTIDGKVVGEGMKPDSANFFEKPAELTGGRHSIRLDYFQRGGSKSVSLRWMPPGQPGGLIPSKVLWPSTP